MLLLPLPSPLLVFSPSPRQSFSLKIIPKWVSVTPEPERPIAHPEYLILTCTPHPGPPFRVFSP
ncbi:hypothetical protein I79_009798 [Cricetulus griseus]|uniref:Uncharacterized protein n=1 Tax=Cricetulus griseus TaxID=10029 RepID=G3HGQ8_CRIGR|nr:hypothetical protein I79_009798 [Cricetulus griseus]